MCNFVYVPWFKCALPRFAIGQDFVIIFKKIDGGVVAESAIK